jgi:5-formyltetrahydrofolate cyclo-ligase
MNKMNISKDVYEYLTNFADDKTILNMLSVNKDFRDEKFFERVLRRKYPFLMAFRNKTETWKKLFLRMTHYIAKLEKKFGIPYIPKEDYNPEQFYKDYKDRKDIFERLCIMQL